MSDGVQYGHAGRHHGDGSADCPRELHHHHDERCDPPHVQRAQQARRALADRRQGAREAFWDGVKDDTARALDEAVDTAVRVRVTDEILTAGYGAVAGQSVGGTEFFPPPRLMRVMVEAALAAAGFMVEE